MARLKNRKGKPSITAKHPDSDDEEKKPKFSKKRHRHKSCRKRIKIDREKTIKLARKGLPEDIQHSGYSEVTTQKIRFEADIFLLILGTCRKNDVNFNVYL